MQLLIVLYIGIIPLVLGPLARFNLNFNFTFEPLILITWALLWFKNEKSALVWSIVCGLTMDIIDYRPIGIWFFVLVGLCIGLIFLKRRFFEISSFILSILALACATLVMVVFIEMMGKVFDLTSVILTVSINSVIASIVYYLLAVRMRMIHEWTGRVIHR